MQINITEQKFGGIGYLSSLTKTIIDLYKNINQEDHTVEEYIMKSSYGKQYMTKDNIQKELYKNLEDIKDKISKLLESNEESEIEKIIKSAQSNHAIILIRYLLREINNNEVQTEYKKNREEYITDILQRFTKKIKIPVGQDEISQLTKELKTILDSKKKNASLDKDNLVSILEIIYETCRNENEFEAKLKETLGNSGFTQDTRKQLAQHIISICENIGNSQYKNQEEKKEFLYGLAFTLQGRGAGIIRSPSKKIEPPASPPLLQVHTHYPYLYSRVHCIVTPPPAEQIDTVSQQNALVFSEAPVKRVVHDPVLTRHSKRDTHGTIREAPPLPQYQYHNDTAPPPTQTRDARGVNPAPLRSQHPIFQTPSLQRFSSNCAPPTPSTHRASPQIAFIHNQQQPSPRGVCPPLLTGDKPGNESYIMSSKFVWGDTPPPSHAQSESPSHPVNFINPHFRRGQNSPSQLRR